MKKILYILLAVFILTSCNNPKNEKNENSIVLNDTQGNKVELKNPAQRVVCLFDPSVDVIYMLQKQETLVGIPAELYFDKELFDYFKQIDRRVEKKEIATPGSNDMANLESVVALKPDLVIAKQLPTSTISTLNDMGIAVYLASSDTYDNLFKEMSDISLMLGNEKRGDELIAYAKEEAKKIQGNDKRDSSNDSKKTVYFSWANGRIFTTTGLESMMNNCLELAAVENVCRTNIDRMNVNPETLIKWNPDMIVMWNDSPELFYEKNELSTIKAIANKQVYNLMPMFFYSPHTFKALCAAIAINNWAYTPDEGNAKNKIEDIIVKLYGEDNGTKLIKSL